MKTYRHLLTVAALTAVMSTSAQGVRIYLKGYGSPIDYPASQIEKIEFYPAEEDNNHNNDNPNQGNEDPTEDKKFLEETGIQFLNQVKASDFRNITKSVSKLDEYDADALEDWSEDCLNAVKTALGGSYTEEGKYGYIYQYTDYKYLLKASTFTGHFIVRNNKWVKESDASDLQFTFTDSNGKVCVARVTTSGSTKTIHVVDDDDSQGWNGNIRNYDRNKYYIDVPSHIEATYTMGGKEMVSVSVDIDVSALGEEWDLSSQGASTSVYARVSKESGGQYDIVVNRAGYYAGSGAYVDFSLSNDGQVILTAEATAAGTLNVNSKNVYDEPEIAPEDFGAASANVDILGRVQVKSTINNVGNFVKYLQDADDKDDDKSEHRRMVGRANSELNAEFFYNGGSDSRGTLAMESFERDSWGSKKRYEARPIITFTSDGSSYAFDTYFSEDAFHTVVDTYKNLVDDFNDLLKSRKK